MSPLLHMTGMHCYLGLHCLTDIQIQRNLFGVDNALQPPVK